MPKAKCLLASSFQGRMSDGGRERGREVPVNYGRKSPVSYLCSPYWRILSKSCRRLMPSNLLALVRFQPDCSSA